MWRKVGQDSAVFAGSALLMVALQVAFRLLSIHDLSPDDYGRAALLISIFNVAILLGNFGIPVAAARLSARSTGRARGLGLLANATRAAVLPSAVSSIVLGGVTYAVTGSVLLGIVCAAGVPPMVVSVIYAGFVRGKGFVWRSAAVQPANAAAQLVVLLLVTALGLHVGVGWVLVSFCIGNVAALLLALVFVLGWVKQHHRKDGQPDAEASPRRILAFSAWLSVANAAIVCLTILPRIALVHVSYAEVGIFDLALLIYSIPQRLTASLVMALIPAAASRQVKGRRVAVPAARDILVLTAACAALDALLWWTHVLRKVLIFGGLGGYTHAEPLLLIVLLAAPAELFFAINSGVLQAFGHSRRLAGLTLVVLAVSTALTPLAVALGSRFLAGLLALDYWALYLGSRRVSAEEIEERSIFSRTPATARPNEVAA